MLLQYWEKAEFPFNAIPKLASLGVAGGTIKVIISLHCNFLYLSFYALYMANLYLILWVRVNLGVAYIYVTRVFLLLS